jgi:hypothetical protein
MEISFTCAGFEAGGANTPSIFDPWYKVGSEAQVTIGTDRSSPFDRNPVALKVEVLCDKDDEGLNFCPTGGVGAANPGFWGMVRVLPHHTADQFLLLSFSRMLCCQFCKRAPSLK